MFRSLVKCLKLQGNMAVLNGAITCRSGQIEDTKKI